MTDLADAGNFDSFDNSCWITIEGPSPDYLLAFLADHGVVYDQIVQESDWLFYVHVVSYNPHEVQLEGYSINDGTYVSEVDVFRGRYL